MAHSRIIDELIRRDPARVRADLDAIQRDRESLDAEEALLNQVLAIQAMRNGREDGATGTAKTRVRPGSDDGPKTRRRRDGPSVSKIVSDIMRDNAGTWMTYDEVYDELRKRGVEATRNAMRVALGRWAERGELESDEDGTHRFVAPHAGTQTTLEGGNS